MTMPLVLAQFYGSTAYYALMIGLAVAVIVAFVVVKRRQG